MAFLVIGGITVLVLSALFFSTGRKRKAMVDIEGSSTPMWIFDAETLKVLEVNKAAIALYGYTEQEFLQMTIKDLRVEWDVDKLQAHVKDTALKGKNTGIWKHRKKNGESLLVRVSAESTLFNGKQQRLVTIEDITYTLTAHNK